MGRVGYANRNDRDDDDDDDDATRGGAAGIKRRMSADIKGPGGELQRQGRGTSRGQGSLIDGETSKGKHRRWVIVNCRETSWFCRGFVRSLN